MYNEEVDAVLIRCWQSPSYGYSVMSRKPKSVFRKSDLKKICMTIRSGNRK